MKIFRTYIGGSKRNELKIFEDIANSPQIDWIDYKRHFIMFDKDIRLVINSRKILFYELSVFFIILSLICVVINTPISLTALVISIALRKYSEHLRRRENKIDLLNELTLSIIFKEIKNSTGLDLL